MKYKRMLWALLTGCLMLSGCGAQTEEASGGNAWPWILGLLGLAVLALAVYQTHCYIQYIRKARKRRRKNTHGVEPLTIALYAAAAVLLLLSLIVGVVTAPQPDPTDPSDEPQQTTKPTEDDPAAPTGWIEDGDSRYYMLTPDTFATGWMEMDGRLYYFQDNGMTLNGWHEVEGIRRYFRADGSMARGEEEIDGVKHFFTSTGAEVELVNPWNPVPEGYTVELKELSLHYAVDDIWVDVRIYDALIEMMDACNEAAPRCCVTSAYRTQEDQAEIFQNRVNRFLGQGYTQEEAEEQAKTMASVPGYSEHQLGLAVDIVDTRSWSGASPEGQEYPALEWLMEHSWEYGFILRYPDDKAEVTGIMFESWHYRYVGKELARELHDSGLTLEEYLQNLD